MRRRVVFDTNTLVSAALLSASVPRRALDKALTTGVLLVSEQTTRELVTVLLRTKCDQQLQREKRELFLIVTGDADL